MTLGEQIKEARENKNYSQEELAELCGVSRQAVSKWENDISVPQGTNRETLNEVLGIECPREDKNTLKSKFFVWSGWITAAVLLVAVICIGLYVITRPGQQDSGRMSGEGVSQEGQNPGQMPDGVSQEGSSSGQMPDEGTSGTDGKEETDGQPSVTSVRFYDGEQKEVPDEALWYNAAYIESILIQWEGNAPESISIHYVPSGSETMEMAELLSTTTILDSGTVTLLNPKALKNGAISGHVTFQLNYGSYTVNSEIYNIFYDPELPPADEETASN